LGKAAGEAGKGHQNDGVVGGGKTRQSPATLPPNDDEKLTLFNSMPAYAGTYTLDHEKAVHHVDASWNQAWTGTDQVRFYKLDGNQERQGIINNSKGHGGVWLDACCNRMLRSWDGDSAVHCETANVLATD
jgi:Lipocalin-like domain